MGSKWRKAKIALGMNLCVYVPATLEDASPPDNPGRRSSDDAMISPGSENSDFRPTTPTTPIPSSSGLRLSKSISRSSKKTCAICLGSMKPGQGHAIFTAECTHAFHFHCIASNVKHGNQICPVCRAKWKEIPFKGNPSSDGRARINPVVDWPRDDGYMTILRRLPPARSNSNRNITSLFHSSFHSTEPAIFNDDEYLDPQAESQDNISSTKDAAQSHSSKTVEIRTYPEFTAIPQSMSHDNFTVLINLKAPVTRNQANARAPVDLVTVLDVSGSMAGTKLALLKRAMGFVIQNLGPSDRLSVVSFSSTARRLFPLRRMSDSGRQQALQAVNSLISNGGTNIAEGLRKGAKVMEDRREKNPVCSIILLSDGQDTYTVSGPNGPHQPRPDYGSLLPFSIRGIGSASQIPVHAFGFGADHDATSMHSISETSGGTFSFIEAEAAIQDAFAQCIGGLLSVVVQDLHVDLGCMNPGVSLGPIKSGSYTSRVIEDGRRGSINAGDFYADEEKKFLVSVNVPAGNIVTLMKVGCAYRDPVSKVTVNLENEVRIGRPVVANEREASIEVDRERNRHQAAEAMAEARTLAEEGDLAGAVAVLETCRRASSETASARACDHLYIALDTEMKEMQERMASRRVYEASGRAYMLSGLSSHSWQRATTRGDLTDRANHIHAFQTPSMVDMLSRSQTMVPLGQSRPPPIQPVRSFPRHPQPR